MSKQSLHTHICELVGDISTIYYMNKNKLSLHTDNSGATSECSPPLLITQHTVW